MFKASVFIVVFICYFQEINYILNEYHAMLPPINVENPLLPLPQPLRLIVSSLYMVVNLGKSEQNISRSGIVKINCPI